MYYAFVILIVCEIETFENNLNFSLTWKDFRRTQRNSLVSSIQWHRVLRRARAQVRVRALDHMLGKPYKKDE